MYCMNFSGGDNKTHGQIERADRIDSFEAGQIEARGLLTAFREGKILLLDCDRVYDLNRALVELSYRGSRWRVILELDRVRSGFGGCRTFWRCPRCGRRARYLYFRKPGFLCRECAKLNYRSQQRTKSSINHYRDGMKLAREKLRWEPLIDVVPMDFPHVMPNRPRYMHEATYQRYLARFRKYQAAYQRDSLREMLAILGWNRYGK